MLEVVRGVRVIINPTKAEVKGALDGCDDVIRIMTDTEDNWYVFSAHAITHYDVAMSLGVSGYISVYNWSNDWNTVVLSLYDYDLRKIPESEMMRIDWSGRVL
jgi:hypothetical protein